jgi:hypothetical protein
MTLDDNPPNNYARHHIKEVAFYGKEDWTVDLVIKVPEVGDGRLWVNLLGLKETGMWPLASKRRKPWVDMLCSCLSSLMDGS